MRIAIDARAIEKNMTGIGRYLFDLLNGIPQIDNINEYVLFSTVALNGIDKNFYNNIILKSLNIYKKLFSPLWLNYVLGNYLLDNKFDLFFSPNNLCPLKKSLRLKKIITIHDVMFKIDKNYYSFYYRNYLNLLLSRAIAAADKIITVSECSKKDLMEYYRIPEDKIKVIYEAADSKFKPIVIEDKLEQKLRLKYKISGKFVLYVGLIENRKNILGILKIADISIEENINLKFVLIGKPGYGFNNIKNEIEKRKKNVIYLNYVSDEDLPLIYNLAKIFIFPSFYEGFGLPVLESMQSGIPVITSNRSSLPEIVQNFGIMHNPEDIAGFSQSIKLLLQNNILYREYCSKSLLGAARFNQYLLVQDHLKLFMDL
ncbi:MAG: glycosyltransferase family 4 protein [Ignavibacteriaceae bacterium]